MVLIRILADTAADLQQKCVFPPEPGDRDRADPLLPGGRRRHLGQGLDPPHPARRNADQHSGIDQNIDRPPHRDP